MDNTTLIEIEKLHVSRSHNKILNNISLKIQKGPAFAMVGESGSGKTTLLYAILGLIPYQKGIIKICGRKLEELTPKDRSQLVGMVFQDYSLFPHFTVQQNITFAAKKHNLQQIDERAQFLMNELKIFALSDRYPHELSGGQKQRVAIVRSLILKPKVLFFDEPSAALDTKTTEELANLLEKINAQSQVIVVSHDIPFIRKFCPLGCLMKDGEISKIGNFETLLN